MAPDLLADAEAQRWDELAAGMIARCDGGDCPVEVDAILLKLLSSGRVRGLGVALERQPDLPFLLRVFAADSAVRTLNATYHEIEALVAESEAGGQTELRSLTAALRAEYFLWHGDLTAAPIAAAFLAGAPTDVGGPWDVLGRTRLQRIVGLAEFFGPGAAGDEDAAMRPICASFASIGCTEERVTTRLLVLLARSMLRRETGPEQSRLFRAGYEELLALGSDRIPGVMVVWAWLAASAWDYGTVKECLEQLESVDAVGFSTLTDDMRTLLGTLLVFVETGPTAQTLQLLAEDCERVRDHSLLAAGIPVYVAGLLADVGERRLARHLVPRTNSSTPLPFAAYVDVATLAARLDILDGVGESAVADVEVLLDQTEGPGRHGTAATAALRAARDCERMGMLESAARLRARGLGLLGDQRSWTPREQFYALPLGASDSPFERSAPDGAHAGEIRVLGPDLVLMRGGNRVHPGSVAAQLLVTLAAERRPVTTDWVLEALWPGTDPDTGRKRLNAVVYRLRRLLALGMEELIVRNARGLSLELPPGWSVDAWEFLDLAAGTPEERRHAVERYTGDLCYRQFAYVDALDDPRDRLRDRWVDTAIELVDAGEIDASRVATLARERGISDDRLTSSARH